MSLCQRLSLSNSFARLFSTLLTGDLTTPDTQNILLPTGVEVIKLVHWLPWQQSESCVCSGFPLTPPLLEIRAGIHECLKLAHCVDVMKFEQK